MNALAGGGSFVSMPALIAAGLPSVAANATSTAALFPGGLASAWVYRGGARPLPLPGASFPVLVAATVVGGLVGGLLLLWTPSSTFDQVLPWLLLAATAMLAAGPRIAPRLAGLAGRPAVLVVLQFGLGVYGGYFGGAVGIMMMAAWRMLTGAEVQALQGARTLMVTAANAVAVATFIVAGAVAWPFALALGAGALAGGYAGAHVGRRLSAPVIKWATVALCAGVTVLFFLRRVCSRSRRGPRAGQRARLVGGRRHPHTTPSDPVTSPRPSTAWRPFPCAPPEAPLR
ncbi:MAG: sulfite exporter TauE/SafE family protein [Phenylobacterium sp.]|uniref:sulfite exporter TauE/SafE family protein n=1 Tax=Phenylobacterium sp. TaxID=1871053 RepID=UPI003919BDE5